MVTRVKLSYNSTSTRENFMVNLDTENNVIM